MKGAARGTCLAIVILALAGCRGTAWHGRELLRQGHPARVLTEVRAAGSDAFIVRGAALRQLGRAREARTSLLIGLSLDPRSATGHHELAVVEAALGSWGGALAALETAEALAPGRACVRRDLALLLLWRAAFRRGVGQRRDALVDRERALDLAPCLADAPVGRVPCGAGASPALERPLPPRRCSLRRPSRFLAALARRELLLACRGPTLALRLESAGCPAHARAVWEALAREAPADPRWPLEVARMLLVGGRSDDRRRAELYLTNHVYLSGDRAAASIRVARTLEQTGFHRAATRRAVQALALAEGLDQAVAALRAVARTGTASQVQEAARVVLGTEWGAPGRQVQRIVEAITRGGQAPRRTPRR